VGRSKDRSWEVEKVGRWEAMEVGIGNAECGMKKNRRWDGVKRWKMGEG
jgi:hypothetical protein